MARRREAMRRPTDPILSWRGPYWEPRDMWIGLYWTEQEVGRFHAELGDWSSPSGNWSRDRRMNLYVCIVPCFPIHIRWWRRP